MDSTQCIRVTARMRKTQYLRVVNYLVALLATVACLIALPACGGAEPDAPRPREVSLTLDYRPNAVHTAIYAAEGSGAFERNGIDLLIRQPASSADAGRLLAGGRTDFAIMDIADLALARARGARLEAVTAIAAHPLAAVIVGPGRSGNPAPDLDGATVGVTGVASDDLVLDTVLRGEGLGRSDVRRISVGFGAVPALSAGRLDAATAFWNSEGVELRRAGVPIRELRVNDFGAPDYPQLLLVADESRIARGAGLICALTRGISVGGRLTVKSPLRALSYLLDANPELDRGLMTAELESLIEASVISGRIRASRRAIGEWIGWSRNGGLLNSREARLARGMVPSQRTACNRSG